MNARHWPFPNRCKPSLFAQPASLVGSARGQRGCYLWRPRVDPSPDEIDLRCRKNVFVGGPFRLAHPREQIGQLAGPRISGNDPRPLIAAGDHGVPVVSPESSPLFLRPMTGNAGLREDGKHITFEIRARTESRGRRCKRGGIRGEASKRQGLHHATKRLRRPRFRALQATPAPAGPADCVRSQRRTRCPCPRRPRVP